MDHDTLVTRWTTIHLSRGGPEVDHEVVTRIEGHQSASGEENKALGAEMVKTRTRIIIFGRS